MSSCRKCRGYLSDGHGAEDVEEDKGAVCKILAQQVAVGQPLDVGQRHERQLGNYSSIKAEQKRKQHIQIYILYCFFSDQNRFKVINTRPFLLFLSCSLTFNEKVKHMTWTYMELNMPIKAVKQKPMANMDFMRTYKQIGLNMKFDYIWLTGWDITVLFYINDVKV